jgi:hypothetical protein
LGFGGGGDSGLTGTAAHTHDSAVGNGGNLSSTITNIDSGLLSDNIKINALVLG